MIAFIERHMNSWLLLGCVAGLAWPHWDWASNDHVKLILITATFIACFKLNLEEFKRLAWKSISLIVLIRYTLLAWIFYMLANTLAPPDIALAILLICALPAGISSPAITHLYEGQVTLAATITIATTLMVPFSIPMLFSFAESVTVMPNPAQLLQTLLVILVLPCILFVFTRNIEPLKQTIHKNGKATVILLTAFMLAMVVGRQRDYVLDDLNIFFIMVPVTFVVLASLLIFGWIAGKRFNRDQQIALATTSGFNNAALGVALAAIHFSPSVIIVMVAAELSWALLPYVMRGLLKT